MRILYMHDYVRRLNGLAIINNYVCSFFGQRLKEKLCHRLGSTTVVTTDRAHFWSSLVVRDGWVVRARLVVKIIAIEFYNSYNCSMVAMRVQLSDSIKDV